jgi:phosphoribosylanthranilate isomerase
MAATGLKSAEVAGRQEGALLRKVCGMRATENIMAMLALQPDFLGFIFYPGSARFVGQDLDAQLLHRFPKHTKKVGVFVNAGPDTILEAVRKYQLEAVQLHGEESPELCRQFKNEGLLVFKAFPVDDDFDFERLRFFEGSCDFYLFDTKGQQYGGTGMTFDWAVLKRYTGSTPFFLSGGIDLEHAAQINTLSLPALKGIDINSRFETAPALKDVGKVAAFFKSLNLG